MSSPEGSSVTFRRVPATLRRNAIERFARRLQNDVARGVPFDTLITGDAELRRLNLQFRRKDYATDVLSFPALPDSDPSRARNDPSRLSNPSRARKQAVSPPRVDSPGRRPRVVLGDLAISLGRARAQAREFGHTIEQEIQILMLHGVLHLMGHDHEIDRGRMARFEKRWRARLGLPAGLIERVRS